MAIKKKILSNQNGIEVVEFAYPISIDILYQNKQSAKFVDDALATTISEYVGSRSHMVYSDHFDPLGRLLSRVVIIGDTNKINFE